ncbi:MAG: hypothetical protein ACRED1_06050 [Limisphaerales bacterium]
MEELETQVNACGMIRLPFRRSPGTDVPRLYRVSRIGGDSSRPILFILFILSKNPKAQELHRTG